MNAENRETLTGYGACIERGIIREVQAGPRYRVESFTRAGVISRPIEAINRYVNEYYGEPPVSNKYTYAAGDEVFFFLFPDGRGMILGKMGE